LTHTFFVPTRTSLPAFPPALTRRRPGQIGFTRSSITATGFRSAATAARCGRRGYDWTDRYPAIVSAAAKLRATSFILDGEAVVCGPDGVAVFDALHRHGTVSEAMLYAFDLLELDGNDDPGAGSRMVNG
jgi:hypothetical protein